MKKIKHILPFLLLFSIGLCAQKQGQERADSLTARLNANRPDTIRENILYDLANTYTGINPETGIKYGLQAVELALKLGNKTRLADAHNVLGTNYYYSAKYANAIQEWFSAMKLFEETGNKMGVGGALCNIGNVYDDEQEWDKALENYTKAEKILTEAGSKGYLANVTGNMASAYKAKKNYTKALEYYLKALRMHQKIGNLQAASVVSNGIGSLYLEQKKYEPALNYYFIALKTARDVGYNTGEAASLENIGSAYLNMVQDTVNFHYDRRQRDDPNNKLDLTAQINDTLPHARAARLHLAIYFLTRARDLSKKIDMEDALQASYETLYEAYKAKGDYILALQYHEKYITLRDSMFNKENTKKIMEQQMKYDYDKKEAATKAEQDKKDIQQRNIRNSITGGLAGALIFGFVVYRQRNRVKKEKKNVEKEKARSEELLLNILPGEVAEELKQKGSSDAKLLDEVTVLFTDFKGFTQLSEKMSPTELVAEINECFSAFDHIMEKYNIEKIKTIGDSYMAAGGLPTANKTHPEDVVKAALEIQKFMQKHKADREAQNKLFFEIRIGIHTGPVVAGIVGVKKFQYDIWGDTVNTASRMESSGEVGKVNISGTTYELVKDKFTCTHRGKVQAKGKGEVDMYFVEG